MWCRYNTVNLLQNPYNRHPLACPWGQDMACLLWFYNLIHFLALLSQCRMCYHDSRLDRIIMALDCTLQPATDLNHQIQLSLIWYGQFSPNTHNWHLVAHLWQTRYGVFDLSWKYDLCWTFIVSLLHTTLYNSRSYINETLLLLLYSWWMEHNFWVWCRISL